MSLDIDKITHMPIPKDLPFQIGKLGHVVLKVTDLAHSVEFYTQVLGFRVSDVYPEAMVPGGMVFMRYNTDHHGVALVGGAAARSQAQEMHHMAFEVATLDEVFRARSHLESNGVVIDFEGRRRAGCQIAVEFRDPDDHRLEIYWNIDQIGTEGVVRASEEWRWAHSLEEALDNPPPGQRPVLGDPTLRR